MVRYSKLADYQILARLQDVLEKENVSYTDDGIEAIIFTAQGDMRQVSTINRYRHHAPEQVIALCKI